MQNQIRRIPTKPNQFSTVSDSLLFNTILSSDAIRLMIILLNNSESYTIVLSHYSKQFGWSKGKQAQIVNELKSNGYLKQIRLSKGKNDFEYYYILSEYGNLNKTDKVDEPVGVVVASQPQPIVEPTTPQPTSTELEKQLADVLDEAANTYNLTDDEVLIIVEHYYQQIEAGVLTMQNFDATKIDASIKKKVMDKRTAYQQDVIKAKLNGKNATERTRVVTNNENWLKQQFALNSYPTEKQISNKFLSIQTSITTADRVIDQRYND